MKRRKNRGPLGPITLAMACALALFGVSAAQASTITVGSALPSGFTSQPFGEKQTLLNTALPEKGVNLVSPVNGVIVRWHMRGAKGGPFYLRVLHPTGAGAFAASGTSAGVMPTADDPQTFTANLPIHAGDLIGVDPTNPTDEIGIVEAAGASFTSIFPLPFDGATVPARDPKTGAEIELNAEIQPTPALTAIAPSFGSIAGGTSVVITGTDFNAASAVKFGDVPATSFNVESETKITAIAPPAVLGGSVDVTVSTLAGTSPTVNADRFDYQSCLVPKLGKKSLKQAKRALRNAGCKPGTVRKLDGANAKDGIVTKQNPKPGQTRVPETKVSITLAPKPAK